MYARSPSHPAALGLNLSGSVAGIPERHPLDKVPRDVYPTIFPKNGAAPFTLAPDGASKTTERTHSPSALMKDGDHVVSVDIQS